MSEKQIDILDELSQNAIDFAYEANSQRAFPDAKDGLKPGQRACIWEMFRKGYSSSKPHVKSAKISGGVCASLWPHSNIAIYETFARMSQPWINNVPEVDWHGANGNIIVGNAPAADRYTEARLSKATEDGMLRDIKKNAVDMILNFSEDEEWPEVLPAIFPRLLVNGCQGVGYTQANFWASYSLQEVSDAIVNYIKTGTVDYESIYPDFPSGGIIINKSELSKINKTGKGRIVVRGKAEIKGKIIFITELPYQEFVEPFIDSVKELIKLDNLNGIKDILNKSSKKNGLLIEIECDNAASVLKQLYEKTNLQKVFNANQQALVNKVPVLLNLKDYFDIYVNHNCSCIKRVNQFDYDKANSRLEIVDGLLKALIHIDEIVKLIKESENSSAAQVRLMNKYDFTENQAKAIVDMRLGKLAHLEGVELENEKTELEKNCKYFKFVIDNEQEQKNILITRLEEFTKKYAAPRKTQLMDISEPKDAINEPPRDVMITITQNDTLFKEDAANYKVSPRNRKGKKNKNNNILSVIKASTIDDLLLFTNFGRMYKIPASKISDSETLINDYVSMKNGEKVISIISNNDNSKNNYAVFFTKFGMIKKTLIGEYLFAKKSGIAAIKLKDGDSIVNVAFMNQERVLIVTRKGWSIYFDTKDIPAIGRTAYGVNAINLTEDDYVIAGLPETENTLAIFTTDGLGKAMSTNELIWQLRRGRGNKIANSEVAGVAFINSKDNIMLVNDTHTLCIAASDLPHLKRESDGNIMHKEGITFISKM